jgi:hypothetical protein
MSSHDDADREKEVVGQIRLRVYVCIAEWSLVGAYLAATIREPNNVLNPFQLAVWSFFSLVILRAAFQYFSQLSYDVVPEKAKIKRAKALQIKVHLFYAALISFCFGT